MSDTKVPDVKQMVLARLEAIDVPEPLTLDMSDSEIEAAMRRIVQRLSQAVQRV